MAVSPLKRMNTMFPLLLLLLLLLKTSTSEYTIGANYGTVANNLPPPPQVANFLQAQTTITSIKLFDSNTQIIQSFSNTNISLTITVPNDNILQLTNLSNAQTWLTTYVTPYYPSTKINRIAVGNEVLATSNKTLIAYLLPAMKALHATLNSLNITDIQVSTPHSLGILSSSEPPSSGRFRRVYDRTIFAPMLQFHLDTKTPFMVNPYPYYGYSQDTLDYALFKPNSGVYDVATGQVYTNMFDAQLDAVYSAMDRLGYGDVEIVVAETGWPSVGDADQPDANLENAVSYNGNLVKHVNSRIGTPLMPNRTFETFVFSLFNENLKASTAERNFGLFRPDFTPVYDVGVLRNGEAGAPSATPTPISPAPISPAPISPAPSYSGNFWCVPKAGASDDLLQGNIDYVCRLGLDCRPIQEGGPCFEPNTVRSHAAFAMNAYYQTYGQNDSNCDFASTGMVITSDPSYATCKYVS